MRAMFGAARRLLSCPDPELLDKDSARLYLVQRWPFNRVIH